MAIFEKFMKHNQLIIEMMENIVKNADISKTGRYITGYHLVIETAPVNLENAVTDKGEVFDTHEDVINILNDTPHDMTPESYEEFRKQFVKTFSQSYGIPEQKVWKRVNTIESIDMTLRKYKYPYTISELDDNSEYVARLSQLRI